MGISTDDDAGAMLLVGTLRGMGHGFDDQGSKYDGDGNLKNWRTEDDRINFEKRTAQVTAFFIADKKVINFSVTQKW